MTKVTIRQSRKTGTGILLAVVILGVLYFTKWGPGIATIDERRERTNQEQIRRQRVLTTPPATYENIGGALREGNAAHKSLENLRQFLEERRRNKEPEGQRPQAEEQATSPPSDN